MQTGYPIASAVGSLTFVCGTGGGASMGFFKSQATKYLGYVHMDDLVGLPDCVCFRAGMSHTAAHCEEQSHKMPSRQQNPEDQKDTFN